MATKKQKFPPLPGTGWESKTYKEDHRKTNPGLHHLYVKCALEDLTLIDKTIQQIGNVARMHMVDYAEALYKVRATHVKESAAFAEADAILLSLRKIGSK